MCDYSAMGLPNRLAKEGEDLVAQYCGGHATVCFVSHVDLEKLANWRRKMATLTGAIMNSIMRVPEPPVPLVCVPPGTVLRLSGIPKNIQRLAGIKTRESEVVFDQLPPIENTFLDGVIFPNGKRLCLQDLVENISAHVLSLDGATEHQDPIETRTHAYNAG